MVNVKQNGILISNKNLKVDKIGLTLSLIYDVNWRPRSCFIQNLTLTIDPWLGQICKIMRSYGSNAIWNLLESRFSAKNIKIGTQIARNPQKIWNYVNWRNNQGRGGKQGKGGYNFFNFLKLMIRQYTTNSRFSEKMRPV